MIQKVEVGQPFSGQIPTQKGAILELWKAGMTVFIQMPGCTTDEIKGFKESFQQYTNIEHIIRGVPIAIWVFDFPFGFLNVNFDAVKAQKIYIDDYLDTKDGIKNLMTFYLLDGQIVKGIKAVGLKSEAVELFHATIKKQLNIGYIKAQYDRALNDIYARYTSEQLSKMGAIFNRGT